jgi:hypothetical protein
MKTVCEPSNALEGHMLQDLLRQRGIESRLDGAGLQSGIGELPAIGLVRLLVDERDYEAARAVIKEWDSSVATDPIPVPPRRPMPGLTGAVIGAALGIAGSWFFFRAPVDAGGIDHNDDGRIDEHWYYSSGGTPVKTEIDRNFDGEIDVVYRYDRRGKIASAEFDDDFNGVFESRSRFEEGNMVSAETDTDGDLQADLQTTFQRGVPVSEATILPGSTQPVRVEYFHLGKMIAAEIDTDGDGKLDEHHKYSSLGEVIEKIQLDPPGDR